MTHKITYNNFIKASQVGDTVLMKEILENSDLTQFSKKDNSDLLYFGTVAFCEAVVNNQSSAIEFLLDNKLIDVLQLRENEDQVLAGLLKQLILQDNLKQIDFIVSMSKEVPQEMPFFKYDKLLSIAYSEQKYNIVEYFLQEEVLKLTNSKKIVLDSLIYRELKENKTTLITKILSMPHLSIKDNYNLYSLIDSASQCNMTEVIDYLVFNTTFLEAINAEKLKSNLVFSDSKYLLSALSKKRLENTLPDNLSTHKTMKGKI